MSFISEEDYEKLKEQISEHRSEHRERKESESSDNDTDTEIKESLDLLESGAKLIISAIKKLRRI